MKRIINKNRKKQRKENQEKQNNFLLTNGSFAGIIKEKIEKAFPDKQDRLNYIKTLIKEF